jgi:predicted small lipoprotein YifL
VIPADRWLRRAAIAALAICVCAACGKKGPPLPPLRYVPAAVTDVKAKRSGAEVRLQFVLPAANAQGEGRIDLDRVEVYAVTIAAQSPSPANRDLLVPKYLVGTIPVRPVREQREEKEGEPERPAAPAVEDKRPAPGEPAIFVEELNQARMTPQITAPAAPDVLPTQPAAAAAVAAAKEAAVVRRVYVVRGLTRGGRAGQPSTRVTLPLTDPPARPGGVTVTYAEKALTVAWIAPVTETPAAAPMTFNVYPAAGTVPLNPAPLSAPAFERPGVVFGTEACFVVRTVVVEGAATVESDPSAAQCVTPVDTFAPAPPQGLSAVAVGGAVNLIWEANKESDLAGYLILRGEAPGDTLQAITTTAIRETTYRDGSVQPGVRYVYAVVAIDRATPPNASPQSARVEETAR